MRLFTSSAQLFVAHTVAPYTIYTTVFALYILLRLYSYILSLAMLLFTLLFVAHFTHLPVLCTQHYSRYTVVFLLLTVQLFTLLFVTLFT
jgi:hypothetical protein